MDFMTIPDGHAEVIPAVGNRPPQCHVFDAESIAAIDAALAAERPLLLRGEPGIGKSQLALAAALVLRRAYVQLVVDARTEASDLMWRYDAVARLAEAQLQGALGPASGGRAAASRRAFRLAAKDPHRGLRERLAVTRYITPGPLWWAFDWAGAQTQADLVGAAAPLPPDRGDAPRRADPARRCDPDNGCVVLIDEIDKAETDVPNGLLEALGAGRFRPLGSDNDVIATGRAPLVIITTNEERALPDAFLRRCMVLHMRLPSARRAARALKRQLVQRGAAHLRAMGHTPRGRFLVQAANLLIEDRLAADQARRLPLPGQAEYLDLVRAVLRLAGDDPGRQRAVLKRIAAFALKKHPDAVAEQSAGVAADPTAGRQL
jgi:MoxR-like ATPase